MNAIIHVAGLTKTYGTMTAVDGISFDVAPGEIFGMVGPNGAGKTTTIECLEGLRKPNGGTLCVLGVDPQQAGKLLRERTGIQLQQSNLPDRMRVWEALDLYASFYPTALDWRPLIGQLGLEEKRNTPFARLSGGQKQRLFIGLALLPNPQLIFLDELTTGLDPQARHAIWDLVRAVRERGKTVVLTTHFMEEAERLCDRVAILDHGRIVALDSPEALIRDLGQEESVVFRLDAPPPEELLRDLRQAAHLEVDGVRVTVHSLSGRETSLVGEVVQRLTARSVPFHDLRTEQPTLEDVFLRLTGRRMRE
jgi:ABC-2 type transport system ATP-binding protein